MLFDSAKMVPFGRPSPAVLACVLIACVSLGSATLDGGPEIVIASESALGLTKGNALYLTCVATYGDANETAVTWEREGIAVSNGSRTTILAETFTIGTGRLFIQSVLEVCSLDSEDTGEYRCAVFGGDSAKFNVTVTREAIPAMIVLSSNNTDVVAGDTVYLTCVAYGDPPLSVGWLRGDRELSNGSRVTVYEEEREMEGGERLVTSVLEVCSAGQLDTGEYTCAAANSRGNTSVNMELAVSSPNPATIVLSSNNTNAFAGDTVYLACVAYGDPPLSVGWLRGDRELSNGSRVTVYEEQREMEGGERFVTSVLEVCSVGQSDAGEYSCVAANSRGNSSAKIELTVTSPNPATIALSSNNTEVVAGDTVYLTCVAYGDPPLSIGWLRGDRELSNGSRVTVYEEEREMEGGERFITSVLEVCSVDQSDAGEYSCVVANSRGNSSAKMELTVSSPNPANIVLSSNNTDVFVGDTVYLTCVGYGDPPLSVGWLRGDRELSNGSRVTVYEEERETEGGERFITSVLEVCSVTQSDAGEYSCVATNGRGNSSAKIELLLSSPNPAEIVLSSNNTEVIAGDTVYLTCVGYGDPPLSVGWLRGDRELSNGSRVTVYEEEREMEGGERLVTSVLEVCSVGQSDAGEYNCVAANSRGNSSAKMELTVSSPNPAKIALSSTNTDVVAGDTVYLTCVAYGDPPLSVGWLRGDRELSNGSRVTVYEEEREIEGGEKFVTSVLEVCSVGQSDAGEYSCVASNSRGNSSAKMELTVSSPSPATIVLSSNNTDVIAGDTVYLMCVAYGDPPLSVGWLRGDRELSNGSRVTVYEEEREMEGGESFLTSVLEVCSVGQSDAGEYSCIAANSRGNSSAIMELTVSSPNPAKIVLSSNNTDVIAGDTVYLTCVGYGDPPLSVGWLRGDRELSNGSRVTVYEEEREMEGGERIVTSVLEVCSVAQSDAGEYNCVASNSRGNSSAIMELTVSSPNPAKIILSSNNTDVIAGDTVYLTCVGYGDPPLSVSWLRGDRELSNGSRVTVYEEERETEGGERFVTSVLEVCSVGQSDAGEYNCVAMNSRGNSSAKMELTVSSPNPATIVLSSNNTEVIAGDTVYLTCVAYGDPPLSVGWLRGDRELSNGSRVTVYEEEREMEGGERFVTSVLEVCSVGQSDAGEYSCVATNGRGNSSAKMELTVSSPNPAKIVLSSNNTDVIAGDAVYLTCVAYGDPPLSIGWLRGDRELSNGSRVTVYEEEREMEGGERFLTSVLEVCSVGQSDAGEYSCVAANSRGNSSTKMKLTVSSPNPAKIVLSPNNADIIAGDTVYLTCVGYGDPPLSVGWLRGDRELSNGSRVTVYEEERETEGGGRFVTSVLEVCSVDQSDAGEYNCITSNSKGNSSAKMELTVSSPNPAKIVLSSNNTDVVAGDTVYLTCVGYGDPPLSVGWLRGDRELSNGSRVTVYEEEREMEGGERFVTSVLEVCSVGQLDAGEYNCVAANSRGNSSTKMKLTVSSPNPATIVLSPNNTDVFAGDTVYLTCVAYGDPSLSVGWLRGDRELSNGSRVTVYEEEQETEGGGRFVTSVLSVCSVGQSDAGEYSCVAENRYSSDTASLSLSVSSPSPPTIVLSPHDIVANTTNTTIALTCVTIGNPLPSISWVGYSKGGVAEFSDSSSALVNSSLVSEGGWTFLQSTVFLCPDAVAEFSRVSCVASSRFGSTNATIAVAVADKPHLVPTSDLMLTLNHGERVSLSCTATSVSTATIVWLKNNRLILPQFSRRFSITQNLVPESSNGIENTTQSVLTILGLNSTDSGLYKCKATNQIGSSLMAAPYVLNVVPDVVNLCRKLLPCKNGGTCANIPSGYICWCRQSYTGLDCEEFSTTLSPPSLLAGPKSARPTLYASLALSCMASGNPQPTVTWYRDGVELPGEETSVFSVAEMDLPYLGKYHCTVENSEGRVTSEPAYVGIEGMLQYRVSIATQLDSPTDKNFTSQFISKQSEIFAGRMLTDQAQVYAISPLRDSNSFTQGSKALAQTAMVVTLLADGETRSSDVGQGLERGGLGSVVDVRRFDGCEKETTAIPSASSSTFNITLEWPEVAVGTKVLLPCPCNQAALAERFCEGDYTLGGGWSTPEDSACDASDGIRQLCQVSDVSQVADVILDPDKLAAGDIALIAAILENINLTTASAEVMESILTVLDGLLKVPMETLKASQKESNSSSRVLAFFDALTDAYPLPEDGSPACITKEAFTLSIMRLGANQSDGLSFGSPSPSGALGCGGVAGDTKPQNGGSVSLPPSLFDTVDRRISSRAVFASFVNDALFPRQNEDASGGRVSGAVVSARINGGVRLKGLKDPVQLDFSVTTEVMTQAPSTYLCVFWDQSLNAWRGGWSDEGCKLTGVTSGERRVRCECDHLTNFAVLSGTATPTPNMGISSVDKGIGAVFFVGGILGTVFLVATVVARLRFRIIRTSFITILLVNAAISLSLLHLSLLPSFYATSTRSACVFFSSVFHYLFLVATISLSALALFTSWKPGRMRQRAALAATLCVNWVVPAVVVILSLAPKYTNYYSPEFCRPAREPYWLALLLPAALLHLVSYASLFAALKLTRPFVVLTGEKNAWLIEYTGLWMILILFDIGWGVGLPAMHSLGPGLVGLRAFLQVLFILLSFSLCVVVFAFFFLLSRELRRMWHREASQVLPCGRVKDDEHGAVLTGAAVTEENLYSMSDLPQIPTSGGEDGKTVVEKRAGEEEEEKKEEEEEEKVDLGELMKEDGAGESAEGDGDGCLVTDEVFSNPLAGLESDDDDETDTKF